jgi:hypothetical protein
MGKCALIGAECPQTSDPNARRFCPAWTDGVVWENAKTGEEHVEHCAMRQLVPALIEVVKASNRPAAAVESARNEIVAGFTALIEMTQRPAADAPQAIAPPIQS